MTIRSRFVSMFVLAGASFVLAFLFALATSRPAEATLTASNITLSNAGDITVGSSNDVVRLADSGTYRFWIGHATASSAPFRVTSTGDVTMDDLHANGGDIGGWNINSTSLTRGSGSTTVGIDSGGTNPAFYAGSSTPGSAPFRVTTGGSLNAVVAYLEGVTIGTGTGSNAGTVVVNGDSDSGGVTVYPDFELDGTNGGDMSLTSGADVTISNLAGSGTRAVCANSAGQLVVCP